MYFGPPREVYLFILSELEAKGGEFVEFYDRDERGHVSVSFEATLASDPSGRRYTMITFDYPYHEPPGSLLPRRGVPFPAGYDLFDFWPGEQVDYKGPKCSHSELADTIDALFTRLMGVPPDYIVQGHIRQPIPELPAWTQGISADGRADGSFDSRDYPDLSVMGARGIVETMPVPPPFQIGEHCQPVLGLEDKPYVQRLANGDYHLVQDERSCSLEEAKRFVATVYIAAAQGWPR